MNIKESTSRPWYVFGPGLKKAKTFGKFDQALEEFMRQAEGYWPAHR